MKDILRGRQKDGQDAVIPTKGGHPASPAYVIPTKGGNPTSETNGDIWADGRYYPTPTIIEAAMSLYGGHTVDVIARTDAGAVNLSATTDAILKIITNAKANHQKAICFVTGLPGAGKTLVGLNIGARNYKENEKSSTIFLSGNGPLVAILREALTGV